MRRFARLLVNDYLSRHKHPVDIVLHLVGVPQVFWGIYLSVRNEWRWGIFNIFIGYLLQWVGHRFFEKNEVGEVILIKKIAGKCLPHQGKRKGKGGI